MLRAIGAAVEPGAGGTQRRATVRPFASARHRGRKISEMSWGDRGCVLLPGSLGSCAGMLSSGAVVRPQRWLGRRGVGLRRQRGDVQEPTIRRRRTHRPPPTPTDPHRPSWSRSTSSVWSAGFTSHACLPPAPSGSSRMIQPPGPPLPNLNGGPSSVPNATCGRGRHLRPSIAQRRARFIAAMRSSAATRRAPHTTTDPLRRTPGSRRRRPRSASAT